MYAAMPLKDLIEDRADVLKQDGNLNVYHVSFQKLAASLEEQVQYDPLKHVVLYKDEEGETVVLRTSKHLQVAIQKLHNPRSAVVKLDFTLKRMHHELLL